MRTTILCLIGLAAFACTKERDATRNNNPTSHQEVTTMSAPTKGNDTKPACLYTLTIDKHDSYFRAPGVTLSDFQKVFKAVTPPAMTKSLAATAAWTLEGAPLFFVDPATKRAAVNSAA
ncbi:hypothetical protein KKF84_15395, partial [Myxococcota bacterium]|nr:hypothetical protein [Myxococcota bacterium]MBU1536708.1 hypothetical protein [Myxococcota bacterium]